MGAPASRCPVKTDRPIQKHLIFKAMGLLDPIELRSPVAAGEIVLKNILGTDANFIATKSM
jgi:CxxC motif-containing protein